MKLNRKGLTGTIIIHGLILALLIFGGLTFPDPPPEEEGVLVNFGTDDSGYGTVEPAGDQAGQESPEPVVEESAPVTPQAAQPVPEPVTADNTQDVEEVVVKEDPGPTQEEIRAQQAEAERIRKQREAEQQRLAEQERIRQEQEAERKRLEEEQRKRDEQANRLSNLGKNTFGRPGTGETEGSEGVNPGSGTNQGTSTGTPGATNYGDGAGLGDGLTYGLGNRNAVGQIPLPNVDNCNVTSRIVVTVEIQVDQSGNVVAASVQSATFSDNCIWKTVMEAARKTKFTSDQNASVRQKGWIKYTIEP